ncbi:hypothetical protein ACFOG5_06200 [Pedobacter fastidiosus]|uniref:Mercuric ion transport protein n=1 Tax=Pedobacter fastidiosus TaxID=2765361 RepID=A0ABR7KXU1_9SPHI|nr:hypothetical protein [Pedobacter fastidiosus]MBC6112896.1 hypothetical protein [Pedobacter fastidiosus]
MLDQINNEEIVKGKSWPKKIGWLGISLCVLCCALPVIGGLVGITSLTVLSFYLEKIGMIALGISAFFFWYAWYKKNKKSKTCAVDCDCKTK